MKIALAQLNFHVGNIAYNSKKIVETISYCKAQGADLVVFPELSVCGYPPRDLLTYEGFVTACLSAINAIAANTQNIAVIIGGPSFNPMPNGKKLFNSAFFLEDGRIKTLVHKSLLPTYDVFDEYRYFEPNRHFEIIEYKDRRIALTICEDLWDVLPHPLYNVSPMGELYDKRPDLAINIAASPFSYAHYSSRKLVLKQTVERYKIPLLYVNQVGAQTELVFDGGSMALDINGDVICRLAFFKEEVQVINLINSNDDSRTFQITSTNNSEITPPEKCQLIFEALVLGVRDYFAKLGFKKCLLGLSGGVDSALVCVIATHALGNENVLPVLMPSRFSSDHSITDSQDLCRNLGLKNLVIPIEEIFNAFTLTLKPIFNNLPFDITEENLQSRSRAVLLMAISNKLGYILLNTSNKSELAVGYGTLYGDMCGALSVIGDLYKTQVYELCHWINKKFNNCIPLNILTKEPSAELKPNQKDSDSLPEYGILDKILFHYIEEEKDAQKIIKMGYDENLVTRIINLVNQNEYKRFQAPPVIRVSSKAFGIGRRMPLEGNYSGIF